ncbi:MAG: carboxypeptidase-like regulatory domain-containing protein, partial [Flavobacteriales bacterium]|nr:carboxypeptidase-like regulatory domain-containing protein [Flavobacteriales bacterium]
MRSALLFILLSSTTWLCAQGTGTLHGVVRDELGNTLPQANVSFAATQRGVACDSTGRYELLVPAGVPTTIRWSYTGLLTREEEVLLAAGEVREMNISLRLRTLDVVDIQGTQRQREEGVQPIDARYAEFTPSVQGGVEALLVGELGVATRNELSSGYSVRGGNFDENLVYVNDIEVYRPFLVRAGQQEGLSFPNPDMIERVQFSPGG